MQKSEITPAVLLTAAVAAALALRLTPNAFDWVTGIGGLVLLLVLFSFDQDGYRTVFQSLSFAAVCGFCLLTVAGSVFQMVATDQDAHSVQVRLGATWLFGTLILWAIDRARMSGRAEEDAPVRSSRRTLLTDATPLSTPPAPTFAPAQATSFVETSVPQMNPIAYAATVAPEPVFESPVESPIRVMAEPAEQAPATHPAAIAIPPGKEASVYVSLVGEGIACLRSVRAEHLGRDFYKIVDSMPEGETWEYQPGQVVRCKKKNLSSGKALVAFEEAQRA